MPATPRTDDALPVIAWLGEPPPAGVADSLARIASLKTEWTPEARLIAVWAPAGVEQLRNLPRRTRRPPVIAAAAADPSHGERMEWIRAGADDLVSLAAFPIAVARRLRSGGAIAGIGADPSVPDLSGRPAGRDPTSLVEPLVMVEEFEAAPPPVVAPEAPPLGVAPSLPPPADAFPPLRIPAPPGGHSAEAARWAQSAAAYLGAREAWAARWGPAGLARLLELFHLRDGVRAAGPTGLSTVFGSPDAAKCWPALVRRGPTRQRQGIEVAEAEIVSVGTDGVIAALPWPVRPRQKLVIDINTDDHTAAQLLVESRWQRRVGARAWHAGLLLVEIRIRPLPAG
jgi:CheY-like chemotaxis protein